MFFCGSGGMADAQASGACGSNTVWVQVPSSALRKKGTSFSRACPFFVGAGAPPPRVQGLVFDSVGAKQAPLEPGAPSSACCEEVYAPGFEVSSQHSCFVGPLGGKKVHWTFFLFRLAPSSLDIENEEDAPPPRVQGLVYESRQIFIIS